VVVVGSKEAGKRGRRGPKTAEGRLAVRLNASTHGILSPQPVVLAYEKPEDWANHRAAILDSLAPEGGLEEVLAERVALMSWRLNRVTLYEVERLQEDQDGVIEAVRQERLHEGRMEAIYEGLNPDSLRVATRAHPLNVLDELKMARAVYRNVCRLSDASEADTRRVEGGYGAVVLDLAARGAINMVDDPAGRDPDEREVQSRAEALLKRLPGIPEDASLDDADLTLGQLKSLVGWLAREAGIPPEAGTVDDPVYPPEDRLLERVCTTARLDVASLGVEAEKVEAQLLKERRRRVLPSEADLQTIARYEAHLSRQMYQALHELEALQARRRGRAAPLARVDVQT
jgi:hypothetical protein